MPNWTDDEGTSWLGRGQENDESTEAEGDVTDEQYADAMESLKRSYQYVSPRGFPLIFNEAPRRLPLVTVENYIKWYELFLVMPDGSVKALPFPGSEHCLPGESPYGDHVPNPEVVIRFVAKQNWELHRLSLEMMVGRWEIEVKHRYDD